MAIKINFDVTHNPETPTLLLARRNGDILGKLNAHSIELSDSLNDASEVTFNVYKYTDDKIDILWDDIVNFKLVYCIEWNLWFEMTVETNEADETIKTIFCKRLGQAELSQIMLYDIEINTENDIAREEYEIPTVLWNEKHPEASLLHRIMEKVPHYSIIHVDETIMGIQRIFTFDGKSIWDAFTEIGEEIGCLFIANSNSDEYGNIQRTISVYDLESTCVECGYRGEFTGKCPECDSEVIYEGFGNDTTIFVSSDMLANDIQFTTDTDAVKNCFKLEAGDDLMTATVRNCNPNGTDYIWYISNDTKADMSEELVDKLESYDELYNYYQNDYNTELDASSMDAYNNLVYKYRIYDDTLETIDLPVVGYPELMNAFYNTVDFEHYLTSALMPTVKMSDTNAQIELDKLTASISPVSVNSIAVMSAPTADNAILAMAKVIVDSRYKVKVSSSTLEQGLAHQIWKGVFIIENNSDETDKVTSGVVEVLVDDNYQSFVEQKIEKALNKEEKDDLSIVGLFKKSHTEFVLELQKYSLNFLKSFHNSCQTCIDILIEQGVGNKETWSGQEPNLYDDLYTPYFNKLSAIEEEMKVRQEEIDLIAGVYDIDGEIKTYGLQNHIIDIRNNIQKILDFEDYLGEKLWFEFSSFRREDKYENSNYISDGLNNAELFSRAYEFIQVAQKEIYKSAELQHSISTTLKNLLAIKEFEPLVKDFQVGNWLRIMVDDKLYKLRLIKYSINYDDLANISVEFSDVTNPNSTVNSIQGIIAQASSMATSYSHVQRQAQQSEDTRVVIDGWFENGLDATNTMIIGGADNQTQTWDEHGMLFRKYDAVEEDYDDIQLKIINSTLAITDDNWKTVKTAVGAYYYFDPLTGKLTRAYGVNAETIVGKLLIGEGLTIANSSNTFIVDEHGATLVNANFSIENASGNRKIILNPEEGIKIQGVSDGILEDKFYVDEHGNVMIKGALTSGSTVTGAIIEGGILNIGNNNFMVDEYGNVNIGNGKFTFDAETGDASFYGTIQASMIYGQIASDSITDLLNGKNLVGGSLNIGNGAFVVDENGNVTIQSGSISWGTIDGADEIYNSIEDAKDAADDAYDMAYLVNNDIVKLAKGEYTSAGTTFISGNNIYSPNITGGTLTSVASNYNTVIENGALSVWYKSGSWSFRTGRLIAQTNDSTDENTSDYSFKLQSYSDGSGGTTSIKIHANKNIALDGGNGKIYFKDSENTTPVTLSDLLSSGSGAAVFG